jgi:Methane oxygenase PmoA
VKSLVLFLFALPAFCQVHFNRIGDGQIGIEIDGKPFTTFYFGKELAKPYLAPLRATSGTSVTRGFPMEMIEGESRDHPHHKGLWFAHGDVNKANFWGNEPANKDPNAARIVAAGPVDAKAAGDRGTIVAHFDWLDTSGKPLLREDRTMTFYSATGKERVFDIDVTLRAMQKAIFGDTKEGTFAIRLADALSEKRGGKMTNAQGAETMNNVWGKPSPWVDYSGEIKGERLGVAIFDNPKNPRHPTTWHARDYGLFATNIFGQHDFKNPNIPDGTMVLDPGQELRFRYRVVIHPGGTDREQLEKEYKKYAGEK